MGRTQTAAEEFDCDRPKCTTPTVRTPVGGTPPGILLTIDARTLGTREPDGRTVDGMEDAGDLYVCKVDHLRAAIDARIAEVRRTMSGEPEPTDHQEESAAGVGESAGDDDPGYDLDSDDDDAEPDEYPDDELVAANAGSSS